MKVSPKYVAVVMSLMVLATACVKKTPEQTVSTRGVPGNIVILLPRDLKNAEQEPAVLEPSAAIVSVPLEEEYYFGPERFPMEELGEKVSRFLEGRAAIDRVVFIAAGDRVDYANVVKILWEVRRQRVNKAGLLVDQPGGDGPRLFRIEISAEPNDVLTELKPNPLTLVVSVSKDLTVELNRLPMGETSDTSKLTQKLSEVFGQRKEHRAYKPGMTRADATEDERVEKTVTVKAQRSTPYGQLMRVIDAVKGGGANPIILQIDDLAE